MRVCSFTVSEEEGGRVRVESAYLAVSCELVFHRFQLGDTRHGDGPVHDVVLLEEVCKHLGGAQGVDIWGDEKDDGGRGGEGRATMGGEDGAVGVAVGWP